MPYKAIRMSAVASLLLTVVGPLGQPTASSDAGRALCLVNPPVCPAFDATPLVFYGRVTDVGREDAEFYRAIGFRVIEALKGVTTPMVTIRESALFAERFHFRVGDRVLVYAMGGTDNKWGTGCTRTRSVASGDPELRALRDLISGRAGALVYGQVRPPHDHLLNWQLPEMRALTGIGIRIHGKAGASGRVLTDGLARFEQGWLDPGPYTLGIEPSSMYQGRQMAFSVHDDTRCLDLGSLALALR